MEEGEPTEVMRYLAGFGVHAQEAVGQASPPVYLHGDLIRSTMFTTDELGERASPVVAYTAFGEPIGDASLLGTRYQYAGGWGYESGLIALHGANPTLPPITLQHVGARWYDPSAGRFIQRDRIGIRGGLNVYLYCEGDALGRVDPSGRGFKTFLQKVVGWVWEKSVQLFGPKKLPPYKDPPPRIEYYWDWWDFLDFFAPPVCVPDWYLQLQFGPPDQWYPGGGGGSVVDA